MLPRRLPLTCSCINPAGLVCTWFLFPHLMPVFYMGSLVLMEGFNAHYPPSVSWHLQYPGCKDVKTLCISSRNYLILCCKCVWPSTLSNIYPYFAVSAIFKCVFLLSKKPFKTVRGLMIWFSLGLSIGSYNVGVVCYYNNVNLFFWRE